MASLIEPSDVQLRLSEIPKLQLPSSVTPERIQAYIDEASGLLLSAAGYTTPPNTGTPARSAMDGLCTRLVVNMVQRDLFGMDPDMAEMLRRERKDLLDEARDIVVPSTGAAGQFFEMAGAQ